MKSGWSTGRLTLVLYPFGAGAMAINLFFLSLIFSWAGWQIIEPLSAVIGGCLLGIPATWLFARHLRSLMDQVDHGRNI